MKDNQPQFTIVKAIPYSFFSAELYRDVAGRWRGIGSQYLLCLLLVLLLIPLPRMLEQFTKFKQNVYQISKKMPAIKIEEGKFSTPEQQLYDIKDSETGKTVLLIDGSGKTQSFADTTAAIIVTDENILVKRDDGEVNAISFSYFPDISFDRESVYQFLQRTATFTFIFMSIFLFFVSFLYQMFIFLVVALATFVMSWMMGYNLRFLPVLRLAVVSATATLTITALVVGMSWPVSQVVLLAIQLGYLIFAIRANHDSRVI